jgi:invasion protein IalB
MLRPWPPAGRSPLRRPKIGAIGSLRSPWPASALLDSEAVFGRAEPSLGRIPTRDPKASMQPLLFARRPAALRLRRSAAGLVAAVLWTAAQCVSSASAQGVVKGKHGDWETRCETPPGAEREQCALIQSIAAEDRPNITLVVIVLRTADGKSQLLRVIAPLGVLLTNDLGLKIDQTDLGRARFVRCLPNGCIAEVAMDDKLIDRMKTGKSATFIIFETPDEGIGIPLALAGFKEALEQLP